MPSFSVEPNNDPSGYSVMPLITGFMNWPSWRLPITWMGGRPATHRFHLRERRCSMHQGVDLSGSPPSSSVVLNKSRNLARHQKRRGPPLRRRQKRTLQKMQFRSSMLLLSARSSFASSGYQSVPTVTRILFDGRDVCLRVSGYRQTTTFVFRFLRKEKNYEHCYPD